MLTTPKAERLTLVIYGLRNSGKSSLTNNLLRTSASIVSDRPGTTTDPVVHAMEMGPLGPVSVVDTAGFDDLDDELGSMRVERSERKLETADIVLFVTRGDVPPTAQEEALAERLRRRNLPCLTVLTFADSGICDEKSVFAPGFRKILVDNRSGHGIEDLDMALQRFSDKIEREITPLEGLVQAGEMILLVTPIDASAPKARMILPQVETIRDILDKDCVMTVTTEKRLSHCYDALKERPSLVITDSQAFSEVGAALPEDQLLTSFSIVFARKKGDLGFFVESLGKLKEVPPGGRILVLEACKHHRMNDDIGTVKIPNLFRKKVRPDVSFELKQEIPSSNELRNYDFVINCAGCMVTRREMMKRVSLLKENKIPGTNYGLFLAWGKGLLPRALEPFPVEHALYRSVSF
ncbi:[FeFe] hydrogenase H-cluster maturation GTPase HydF [Dethiosulfovibrio sp. F2B]|uniref:[FeFe] hydrogenase H-cluster maturation GTPase HydF n=1 Tax=Dethiosulfovibrio faecalis TaxID=2720018 RepID=UPI001F410B57|nr:[FeFe] hydrogenase H-cluster maturation GTPase HydF [Dethiosulfovibrio faecalis]MCF4152319.1 [FeFe] hydrogenase H-cluster maturation GTPase HydF [Dethiosulfovibrio faecalis]